MAALALRAVVISAFCFLHFCFPRFCFAQTTNWVECQAVHTVRWTPVLLGSNEWAVAVTNIELGTNFYWVTLWTNGLPDWQSNASGAQWRLVGTNVQMQLLSNTVGAKWTK